MYYLLIIATMYNTSHITTIKVDNFRSEKACQDHGKQLSKDMDRQFAIRFANCYKQPE